MKKLITSLLLIGVMGLASVGVIMSVWAAQAAKPEERIAKDEKIPTVDVVVLEPKTVKDPLLLTGTAEPWEAVTISAEVTGKIEWQGVDEGQAVAKDQDLVEINTTSIRARLSQAQAEHNLAVQEFERMRELRERGISSPQEYDRAATNRDATQATLRLAEIDLENSIIKATFDGVVDELENEEGEFVTVGSPMVRLVQVDKIKVVVGIPERDIRHFREGDKVDVQFDAVPDRVLEGQVYRIATTAEATTRTFATEIEVDNADGLLKPGMIARVRLVREAHPNAITIPMFALMNRPEGRYVFLAEDERAVMRSVEVGFFHGGEVYVTRGLSPGDRLIVTGQRTLRDGDAIRVAEAAGD